MEPSSTRKGEDLLLQPEGSRDRQQVIICLWLKYESICLNHFLKFYGLRFLLYLHNRRRITRRNQLISEWKWSVIIDGNQEWQQRKLAQPAYEIYNRVDLCYRIVKLFILLFTVSGVSNRFTSKTGKNASMHSNRSTKIVLLAILKMKNIKNYIFYFDRSNLKGSIF